MPVIKFTNALKRFYPDLHSFSTPGNDLIEVLNKIEEKYPGIKNYLVDDQGGLRKHVNIFINGDILKDRKHLSDTVNAEDEIYIIQALSGG